MGRGSAWLDTGSPKSLNDASNYVRVIEDRTGMKIGCPEEIGFINGWISRVDIESKIEIYKNNEYAQYLMKIIR